MIENRIDVDFSYEDENDVWNNSDTELKVVTECGLKPDTLDITLSRIVNAKIDILMKKFTNCEWLAYLIGDFETRYVDDLIIPEQVVSSGAVTSVGSKPAGVIGVIHSHHNLGAFFSGTDDEYINKNNDISIVIAHNGCKSQVRWTTPCGCKVVCSGNVIIESENIIDEEEFMNEIDSCISKRQDSVSNLPFDPIKEQVYNKNFIAPPKYTRGVRGLSGDITNLLNECITEEEKEEIKDFLVNQYRKVHTMEKRLYANKK